MLYFMYKGEKMSFIDSIKFIEQLNVVDEFFGRGDVSKINYFYITLKVTDETGSPIQISFDDVSKAATDQQIIISDYAGINNYTLGIKDDTTKDFTINDVLFKYNTNIIKLSISKFTGNSTISVQFKTDKDDQKNIATSCYLSDTPSTFYLSR